MTDTKDTADKRASEPGVPPPRGDGPLGSAGRGPAASQEREGSASEGDGAATDVRGRTPSPKVVWDPHTGSWTYPQPRRSGRGKRTRPVLAGGLAGALAALLVALPLAFLSDRSGSSVEQRLADPLPGSGGGAASVVDIAARARPWVVNINVSSGQRTVFGDIPVLGTGSGVIMRSDGHIITNAHVIEDAGEIEVTLASGEKVPAQIVGSDIDTDIGVIKIDREGIPAAVMGTVRDLQVGELAVAIGSPLGLEQSVTSGIVSALGRRLDRRGLPPLFDMIQTDAPITQGNSGGALVSGAGAVIGINTAIAASPDVGVSGTAFAIPIDVAQSVATELIETGRATHPWIGVTGANITPEAAEQFGVEQGAFINEVLPGSPASAAGLRPNDIVIRFDGEVIGTMDDLVIAIRSRDVGDLVGLEVVRNGERVSLRVTLGDKPEDL